MTQAGLPSRFLGPDYCNPTYAGSNRSPSSQAPARRWVKLAIRYGHRDPLVEPTGMGGFTPRGRSRAQILRLGGPGNSRDSIAGISQTLYG